MSELSCAAKNTESIWMTTTEGQMTGMIVYLASLEGGNIPLAERMATLLNIATSPEVDQVNPTEVV